MAWSSVVRTDAPPSALPAAAQPRLFTSLTSRDGITVAVVDANALITHSSNLLGLAHQFVTIAEVLNEVRDPASRMQLIALPFTVDCMEPSEEALSRVVQFARDTGDLQSLSDVDLKLLALSFTLEEQAHGSKHLRIRPPPLQVTQARRLSDQELPGWGNNVPNIEEWEEISEEPHDAPELDSHILGIKNLTLDAADVDCGVSEDEQRLVHAEADHMLRDEGVNSAVEGSCGQTEENSERDVRERQKLTEPKPTLEGKLMVAVGVDASRGEGENTEVGDWQRAISRSTRRKYDKRAARAAMRASESQFHGLLSSTGKSSEDDEQPGQCEQEEGIAALCGTEDNAFQENGEYDSSLRYGGDGTESERHDHVNNMDVHSGGLLSGEKEGSAESIDRKVEVASNDGAESEDSWMLCPLSTSNVACITSDFAMQNVLLQIGLRVISPNGLQVQQLHRWVLKCEACRNVTADVGRIFCPKCGNGGTLFKVSVTVGTNGVVHTGTRRRTNIRGTKYSLPMPKGGRSGILENPVLREDQLPHKLLYPNKKAASQDVFTRSEMFTKNIDKKPAMAPPIREALAIFSGKRNPNDHRFRRR